MLCKTHHSIISFTFTIITNHPPNQFLISITKSFVYTTSNIWNFSPISTLNLHFKVIIPWDWYILCLVSYQKFSITSIEVRNNSSPLNPPPKPITSANDKCTTPLCVRSFPPLGPIHSTILSAVPWSPCLLLQRIVYWLPPSSTFNPSWNFQTMSP